MKRYNRRILPFAFLLALLVLLRFSGAADYVTLENLKRHRVMLHAFAESNYAASVLIYIALFISTAFFVPGAVVLTLAGGFLFGTVLGSVYTNIGAAAGAALAFLSSRYFAGDWIQDRYRLRLAKFNAEIKRNGSLYLLTLRVVPVLPFFLVNFLAGLTEIPFRTFLWTTCLGVLPGSLVYAFMGRQLRSIQSPGGVFSPGVLSALLLLVLFAFLPLAIRRLKRQISKTKVQTDLNSQIPNKDSEMF